MGKPQDLPAGSTQMKIGVLLAISTYLMALAVPYGVGRALLQAVVDLGTTALIAYLALYLVGQRARFDQAFGALCGASSFINLAAVPLYGFNRADQGASLGVLPEFVLLVWGLSLMGHVIRHTFEIGIAMSIFASFVYFVFLSILIAALLPLDSPDASQFSTIESHGALHTGTVYRSGEWSLG